MTNKDKFIEVFGENTDYIKAPPSWWMATYSKPVKEDLSTMEGRIVYKMHENGLTQKELAEKLEITEVSLSRYLNGKRMVKLEVFDKMCEVFNVTADWLLRGGQ